MRSRQARLNRKSRFHRALSIESSMTHLLGRLAVYGAIAALGYAAWTGRMPGRDPEGSGQPTSIGTNKQSVMQNPVHKPESVGLGFSFNGLEEIPFATNDSFQSWLERSESNAAIDLHKILNDRATDSIVGAKLRQLYYDSYHKSDLETAIQRKYRFNLVPFKEASERDLGSIMQALDEISALNPDLTQCLEGIELFLLPKSLIADYSGLNSYDYIEIVGQRRGTIAHELSHSLLNKKGEEFLKGWKRIVESYGFSYPDKLDQDIFGNYAWPDRGPNRSRGVFPEPYAAYLQDGLPIEHVPVLVGHIHSREKIAVRRQVDVDCYHALFMYGKESGVFKDKEIEVLRSLFDHRSVEEKKDYVVQAGDTLSSIGLRFGLDYNRIAAENMIDDPNMIRAGQSLKIEQPVYEKIDFW